MGRMGRSRWARGIGRGCLVAALVALGTGRPVTAGPRVSAAAPPSVITWLRVAPASPRRVYVGGFAVRGYVPGVDPIVSGTLCGFRISRSPDGGTSWHLAPIPILADIRYDPSLGCYGPGPLTLSPDGTHLFSLTEGYVVSVHRGTGLWFSADGGTTWGFPIEQVAPADAGGSEWGAAISPVNPRRVWAFVVGGSQVSLDTMLRSDDGGAHWRVTWPPAGAAPSGGPPGGPPTTPVPGGPPEAPGVEMVADPTRADTAYLGLGTSTTLPPPQEWARTEDGGRTWQPVPLPVATPSGDGTASPYASDIELYADPHLPGLLALRVAGTPAPPGLPPDRRYVSADHGRTWRAVPCPGDLRGECPASTLDNVFGAGKAYGFYRDGVHAFAGAGPAGPRLALSARLPCRGAAVLEAAEGMRAGDPAYLLCRLPDDQRARLAGRLPPITFKLSDPGRVGAAYRSTDGGRSWHTLSPAAGW